MPKALSRQDIWRQEARAKDPEYDKKRKLAEQERRKKQKLVKLEAAAAAKSEADAAAAPAPAPTAAAAAASSAATPSSAAAPSTQLNAAADAVDAMSAALAAVAAAQADEDDREDDEAWKEHKFVSWNRLKEREAASYQLGHDCATSEHEYEDKALIQMMQDALQQASSTIKYLAESLDFEARRNYCSSCVEKLDDKEDPFLDYLADRVEQIELLKLMGEESIEDLRVRHRARFARHGV